ncbi:MAG: hypothetical protein ABEH56_07540 [Salinirussus sp.]
MPIETSDRPCPECDTPLQVAYVSEREQVVGGWACPDCGFLASGDGETGSVEFSDGGEPAYVLRVERPLSAADVAEGRDTVREEFRARASRAGDGEVWQLLDAADGTLIDVVAGGNGDPD